MVFRRSIIVATIVAVILGAVGLPVNVHSCTMKGEDVVAPSCGMCQTASSESTHKLPEKDPCCKDRVEYQHTDPASFVKAGLAMPAPVLVAVLTWSVLAYESHSTGQTQVVHALAHPPPLEQRGQASYLFNSSFLI